MKMKNYLMDLQEESIKKEICIMNYECDYVYEYEVDEAESMAKRNAEALANMLLTPHKSYLPSERTYKVHTDVIYDLLQVKSREEIDLEELRDILTGIASYIEDPYIKKALKGIICETEWNNSWRISLFVTLRITERGPMLPEDYIPKKVTISFN